jgi:hypothetical protein
MLGSIRLTNHTQDLQHVLKKARRTEFGVPCSSEGASSSEMALDSKLILPVLICQRRNGASAL